MSFIFKILFLLCLYTGAQCFNHILFLNCTLSEQEVLQKKDGQPEIRVIQREVILHFGLKVEAPVNSDAVIFLVNGTNLDLRLYLEEKDADHRECELHRYNTNGVNVQWPLQETQDYNYWYNCTIKHRRFTVTSFLRQPWQKPAPGPKGSWPVLKNRDILPTTVALIMKTNTPNVKSALWAQTKLDCQFVIDHEGADYTVEWSSYIHGERKQLFSHNSHSGLTLGTGVDLKALQKGDASYDLPAADKISQGTFACSVSVNPLVATLNIDWIIEVRPKVSINVESILLLVGNGPKTSITCTAEDFYPENVEILWSQIKSSGMSSLGHGPVPAILSKNVRVVGSQDNGTLSMIANLDLHPSVKDSGTQFTCSVFHQSLRVPIRRSFIIYVEEPATVVSFFVLFFATTLVSATLYFAHNPRSARRLKYLMPAHWSCFREESII